MDFRVTLVRIEFQALDDLILSGGDRTNIFRGAFGYALRTACCTADCGSAKTCPRLGACPYARIFEPVWPDGPSGYWEAPRPFVLRVEPGPGLIAAGELFRARMHLFQPDPPWDALRRTFETLAEAGLGPHRAGLHLNRFTVDPEIRLPLEGPAGEGDLRLEFVSPTEIKEGGVVLDEPRFLPLIRRISERVRSLGALYQRWPPDWDSGGLIESASRIELIDWEWQRVERERRSSRTTQRHSIGGFTGWADFRGPAQGLLPLLEVAGWTGVGRQTVWGKGEIRVLAYRPRLPVYS